MVGYKFCEKLRSRSSEVEIVVYGEEPRPAYDRVHLSSYFAGSCADDLLMAPMSWYRDNNITLHVGERGGDVAPGVVRIEHEMDVVADGFARGLDPVLFLAR